MAQPASKRIRGQEDIAQPASTPQKGQRAIAQQGSRPYTRKPPIERLPRNNLHDSLSSTQPSSSDSDRSTSGTSILSSPESRSPVSSKSQAKNTQVSRATRGDIHPSRNNAHSTARVRSSRNGALAGNAHDNRPGDIHLSAEREKLSGRNTQAMIKDVHGLMNAIEDQVQAQLDKKTTENKELHEKLEKSKTNEQRLSTELDSEKKNNILLQGQIRELNEKLEHQLSPEREEKAKLAAENENLEHQLSAEKKEIAKLTAETEDLKQQLFAEREAKTKLAAENENLKQQLSAEKEEKARLGEENAKSTEEKEELTRERKEAEDVSSQTSLKRWEAKNESFSLQEDLEELRERFVTLEKKNTSLEETLEKEQGKIVEERNEYASIFGDKEAIHQNDLEKIELLEVQLSLLGSGFQALSERNRSLETETSRLEIHNQTMSGQNESLRTRVSTLESKYQTLSEKSQALIKHNIRLQGDFTLLSIFLRFIQQRLVDQTAESDELKIENEFLRALLDKLTDEQVKLITALKEPKPAEESSPNNESTANRSLQEQKLYEVYPGFLRCNKIGVRNPSTGLMEVVDFEKKERRKNHG